MWQLLIVREKVRFPFPPLSAISKGVCPVRSRRTARNYCSIRLSDTNDVLTSVYRKIFVRLSCGWRASAARGQFEIPVYPRTASVRHVRCRGPRPFLYVGFFRILMLLRIYFSLISRDDHSMKLQYGSPCQTLSPGVGRAKTKENKNQTLD